MARGRCCWEKCPGLKKSKEKVKQSYRTISRCKECSAKAGLNIWLCSGAKGNEVLPCHIEYHKANFNKMFPLTAGGWWRGGGYAIVVTKSIILLKIPVRWQQNCLSLPSQGCNKGAHTISAASTNQNIDAAGHFRHGWIVPSWRSFGGLNDGLTKGS